MTNIKTRFAPSPTGYMHIGNLRTALYSYLLAKSKRGKFLLRIEDTDQKRYVGDSVNLIERILTDCDLNWDEGYKIGGDAGPYVQSERKDIYLKYAKQLVEQGDAYYCFCTEYIGEVSKSIGSHYGAFSDANINNVIGYDRHCRNLSREEIEENLKNNHSYVIRQKIPFDKKIKFNDCVYGEIEVDSNTLEDQVLIKSDGFPTYNFANVIDDHLMGINWVLRGCEYLSSTPKYNLLYEAFGWEIPNYAHLPLIMGKDKDGNVAKLSKRNGSVSYEDFIKNGYTKEAILNYIALLGWSPNGDQKFFTLKEMKKLFDIKHLNRSPALFDYDKLDWINGKYIRKTSDEDYLEYAKKFSEMILNSYFSPNYDKIILSLKNKINKYSEIEKITEVLFKYEKDYPIEYLLIDKIGATKETGIISLVSLYNMIDYGISIENIIKTINEKDFFEKLEIKKSQFMTALRVALTGVHSTVLDPIIMLETLDIDEIKNRIKITLKKLHERV